MKTIITTVAVLAVAAAAPAFAQDVRVSIDRDQLGTSQGRQVVYEQLQDAARGACRSELSKTRRMNQMSSCTNELVESMVTNLDDTRVSALHSDGYMVAGR